MNPTNRCLLNVRIVYSEYMSALRQSIAPANTVVTYRRVSTSEQADSGLGLEAQTRAMADYAAARGWVIVESHSDEGVSGSKDSTSRPGLANALDAVASGRAAILLVAKGDRIARSVAQLSTMMVSADRAGYALVATDGTVDMSTPASRFTTHVMGAVAELERAMISQRTKAALAVRKSTGAHMGRPTSLSHDVVARIVALKAEGRSLRAIVTELDAAGVPTANGGKWAAATVKKVLDGQAAQRLRT